MTHEPWRVNAGASVLSARVRGMELIHTCYRITDIDRSVAFYEALGFEERRRMSPAGSLSPRSSCSH